MKKIKIISTVLSASIACSIFVSAPFINTISSSAYDCDKNISDYLDDNTFSIYKEYRSGTFTAENSIFNGCDMFTVETVDAAEGFPTIEDKYEYIVASGDIIGNWFDYVREYKNPDYEIKLPLRTSRGLNEEMTGLEDLHTYSIKLMKKCAPYIQVTSDTDSAPLFDNEQLKKEYPDIEIVSMGKNKDGKYTYFLSLNSGKAVLSYEDALKIAAMKTGNTVNIDYAEAYDIQDALLPEYPVYAADTVNSAAAVFEAHGYSVDIEKGREIVPAERVPAYEYFEIITEIKAKEGIVPEIRLYENITHEPHLFTVVYPPEINGTGIPGDLNGDKKVSVADLVMLQKLINSKKEFSASSDVNRDGTVNVFDVVTLRRIILGE